MTNERTIHEEVAARLPEVAAKQEAIRTAQEQLDQVIQKADLSEETKGRYVAYIAPVAKNRRFLVAAGAVLAFPDKDSPVGRKMVEREGDVWIQFRDGLVVLDREDPNFQVLNTWCESRPDICRNAMDPMTEAWAAMKEGQLDLRHRDAVIAKSLDVDAVLKGDARGFTRAGSPTTKAREYVEQANAAS